MLKLFSLALLASAAVAQTTLTTTFANNNGGSAGGAVYFDLTNNVPITITALDVNVNAGAGTIGFWTLPGQSRLGNQTNQGLWTQVATGTFTSVGPGQTTVTLSNPIALAAGLNGIAITSSTGNLYTNGNGTNQTYTTPETTLSAGEATNAAFTGTPFTPRVVNCAITYVPGGGGGTLARAIPYGTGFGSFASVYENFASAAAFDLNGTNWRFQELGGAGWLISAGTPPVSSTNAAALALTDDSEVTQTLSSGFAPSVQICSNGFVSVGGSNGTGFTPAVATMLNSANEAWWVWHDMNPGAAGSGQVKYEFVGGEDVITWDGVYSFGTTVGNTFQMRLSGAPGARIVNLSFTTMSGQGGGILVGYSPAGASVDPGNTDLSGVTSTTLGGTDQPRLTLAGSPRPVIGTSAGLNTTNINPAAVGAVQLLAVTQNLAGLNLSVIGAPGNFFYLGGVDVSIPVTISGGSSTLSLPIPNANNLINGRLYSQTATLVIGANPINVLTSNGLELIIGNL